MAILGEVFSIIRNGASIKQIDGANGFPITRIETISNRVIDRNRLGYANVFDITEYESYVLQSGDILMSHINSEKHLGKTALYIKKGNEKIIHGMNLLMLRANSEVILPLYAKYFFDSNLFLKQIPNITKKSVNQASFTVTALKKLEIKIPQMVEQKRIIDIMSRLDNIIQYRKDQLEKLDLFVKSRFIELFGSCNKEESLINVCNFIDYRGKTPEKSENGIPLITAKNVRDNAFSLNPQEFIPKENYDSVMTRGIPKVNDVLFTTEAPLGNVCRIPAVYEKFCVGQRIITMQPNEDILTSEYLERALLTEKFQEKILANSSGSTVKGIRSKLLEKLTIPIPPLEEQRRFADFVAQVDKSKLAIQQSLDELETLKKSLMQQYFG